MHFKTQSDNSLNARATHLLVRHNDIAIKGKNRPEFERLLMRNLNRVLNSTGNTTVASGRMLVLKPTIDTIEKTCRVSGVTAVAPCLVFEREKITDPAQAELLLKKIANEALEWLQADLAQKLSSNSETSFAIYARRIDKEFPVSSTDIEKSVASFLVNKIPALKIKLKTQEYLLKIEIRQKHILIYSSETAGVKGLPQDPQQRVVCLLSGGIDSPVAAYEMLKRGCNPVLVHFHSMPFTSQASISKVKRMAEKIRQFSPNPIDLWLVPLLDVQRAVRDQCNERFRTIHYRRFMMRIAQEIAQRTRSMALVTGDALGQVASQTLSNIRGIEDAVELPILRPLIATDKLTIIDKANKLGTYEISLEPHDDTCVLFAPQRPATQTKLFILRDEDQRLPVYSLVFNALDQAEKIRIH